jgi:predicted CoA-binding protein
MVLTDLAAIRKILAESRTIAIVGLSPKAERPSNLVARYLMAHGYRVIPVNPGQEVILGEKCFPALAAIREPIDIVDIFRKSADVLPVVREAIAVSARTIWMQEGIIHEAAACLAKKAGLSVVMDHCLKTAHETLFPPVLEAS